MNQFEKDIGEMFDRLPTPIQEKIMERVVGIVARCSINDAILGIEDLMVLTGRSRQFVTRLINSPRKGWKIKDFMRYFEMRKRLCQAACRFESDSEMPLASFLTFKEGIK